MGRTLIPISDLGLTIADYTIRNSNEIGWFKIMHKVSEEIYRRIDNNIYNTESADWWHSDSALHLMRTFFNPVRVGYTKKKLFELLNINPKGKFSLEVGCGGGVFCEEIAKMGFITTGIDPSEPSLKIARRHGQDNQLQIRYQKAMGEALPFRDNSFDVVFCCDVLEHVRDLPKVISEIARVLKPGGVFLYNTFNRTYISKLAAIKILQEWKRWALLPPNIHVWEMFIKPTELQSLLQLNQLDWKEHRGIKPNISIPKFLGYLHQRAKGNLTYQDLSEKIVLVESSMKNILYMGYAIKYYHQYP